MLTAPLQLKANKEIQNLTDVEILNACASEVGSSPENTPKKRKVKYDDEDYT